MDEKSLLKTIRFKAEQRILFLPHAVERMSQPGRMISPTDVRRAIGNGTIIENYPEDVRGHSCLILGHGNDSEPIHVVCSPKDEYLAIITAYLPNPELWTADYSRRVKP